MRKRNYRLLTAATLSLAMLGGSAGTSLPVCSAAELDVKTVQGTEVQSVSPSATFDKDKVKYPDEAEVEANKKLKEVVEEWKATGEYPDYFTDCKFYGEKYLCPIIQLTDISEETKKDFLQRVGVEHEKWQFVKVSYSRNDLMEVQEQIQEDFKDDARIELIILPEIGKVDTRSYYIQVGNTYEFRPTISAAAVPEISIHPHPEYVKEVIEYIKTAYSEDVLEKLVVRNNFDDEIGEVVEEENLLPGRSYKRQYYINDFRDSILVDTLPGSYEDENGNVYDYDFTKTSLVGDADGNGKLELQDAQTILKMALKIKTDGYYPTAARCRFSEDHTGVNLMDAQETLKRALKIEKELLYIENVESYQIYASLETGCTDKPVVKKQLKGKKALMEYVQELDNPELEAYLEKINKSYLENETFLIYSTPVYSEGTEYWSSQTGVSYAVKKLPESDVLLMNLMDEDIVQYAESMNGYFTSIQIVKSDDTEMLSDNMPYVVEHFTDNEAKAVTYNLEKDIAEGCYVINNLQEQENFNTNIGNGFEIKKTASFYENKMVVVNVSAYSGYTGALDYFNIGYKYGKPVRNITVSREKYQQHKKTENTAQKGVYVDVMEYYKDMEQVSVDTWKEVECKIDLKNSMEYTYIDFAPQQQSFVTDYGKSGQLAQGLVRMTTEEEKAEVLAYLEETFKDRSLIEAVEQADVSTKEYVLAFDGNKGTAKTSQEAEQMYVTFELNSIEAYFNMDGSSFEPGKQAVTLMSFEKGTIRRQLAGNDFIKNKQ